MQDNDLKPNEVWSIVGPWTGETSPGTIHCGWMGWCCKNAGFFVWNKNPLTFVFLQKMAALLLCLYFVFTSCFLLWSEMVVPKKTWHINSFGPKTWRSATTASLTPAHRLDMWNVPRCGGRAQLMAPASIGQLHSQWKKNGGLAVCWKQVCKPMRHGSFLHVKKPIVFFFGLSNVWSLSVVFFDFECWFDISRET